MSVTFSAFDHEGRVIQPELAVNLLAGNAARVGAELGLEDFTRGHPIWEGGACTPAQILERLMRWPDGHPDGHLTMRFGELLALARAAQREDPGATITWG